MEKNIRIGWAQTDITPDRPIYVIGQLYSRISSYVHDPLTATCLVLENGQEQMILVSADMPGVPTMHISRILERLDAPGLDRSRVVFSAIHTHNSTMFTKNTTYEVYFKSVLGDLCPEMEEPDDILKDEELEEFFIGKMVGLIEEAWAARRPGGVALAHEYAAVAFNRRPQFLVNGKRESKDVTATAPSRISLATRARPTIPPTCSIPLTSQRPADRRAGLHPVPEPGV